MVSMSDNAISDMTWPQAASALKSARVVLIPVGATEQHGPGIKVRKDATQADLICRMISSRVNPLAVVSPPVIMGVSTHHSRFPGTVSLRPDTFMMVIEDIVRSFTPFGLTKFLIINTHGGNGPALGVSALKLRHELGVEICFCRYAEMAPDVIRELIEPGHAGHGSDHGLAVSLYLDESLVVKEELARGDEDYPYVHTSKRLPIKVTYPYFTDEVTANGVFGDPSRTSREIGQKVVETACQRLAEFVKDFAAKPAPSSKLEGWFRNDE